jgi:hypothetical protein
MTAAVTRQDVIAALGPIDDLLVAEIIATGTTPQELVEARAWLSNDEALLNSGRALPGGRIGQLVEVIERIESEPETGAVEARTSPAPE